MTLLGKFLTAALLAAAALSATAQKSRPAITGISHMCVYAADARCERPLLHPRPRRIKGTDPLDPTGTIYSFSPTQFVEVLPLPADHTLSRTNCVAFTTADASALRDYLQSHAVAGVSDLKTAKDGSHWFKVRDPENNLVEFLQPGRPAAIAPSARTIGTRIIHVGYLVHNKAAEDKFYRDLLGFAPTGTAR